MQRDNLPIRGPAMITFGSTKIYTKGDVMVEIYHDTFEVEGNYGPADTRAKGRYATIKFSPNGKIITGLWPYAALRPGQSIYGVADVNLIVQPLDTTNKQYTFYNVAITKVPSLILSANKTLCGEVEFTALGKEGVSPNTADSLYLAAVSTWNDTTYAPSDIVTQGYTAAWGSVLTGIETQNGWTVDFDLSLEDIVSDAYGIVDKRLSDLKVRASCEPLTISEDQYIAALGTVHSAVGASVASGQDLTLSGTGLVCVVKNCKPLKVGATFGYKTNRVPKIEFTAMPKVVTGVLQDMFSIATS